MIKPSVFWNLLFVGGCVVEFLRKKGVCHISCSDFPILRSEFWLTGSLFVLLLPFSHPHQGHSGCSGLSSILSLRVHCTVKPLITGRGSPSSDVCLLISIPTAVRLPHATSLSCNAVTGWHPRRHSASAWWWDESSPTTFRDACWRVFVIRHLVSCLVDLDWVFSHCAITSLILESVSESDSSETRPARFTDSLLGSTTTMSRIPRVCSLVCIWKCFFYLRLFTCAGLGLGFPTKSGTALTDVSEQAPTCCIQLWVFHTGGASISDTD